MEGNWIPQDTVVPDASSDNRKKYLQVFIFLVLFSLVIAGVYYGWNKYQAVQTERANQITLDDLPHTKQLEILKEASSHFFPLIVESRDLEFADLPDSVRSLLENIEGEVVVSDVTFWERNTGYYVELRSEVATVEELLNLILENSRNFWTPIDSLRTANTVILRLENSEYALNIDIWTQESLVFLSATVIPL